MRKYKGSKDRYHFTLRKNVWIDLYQAFYHKDNKTSKTGNAIATVQVATRYTGFGVHHDPNIEYLQPYPVVIVPSALTWMETVGRGPLPGPDTWLPFEELKIAPCAGQTS
jgi:hypothetical protein